MSKFPFHGFSAGIAATKTVSDSNTFTRVTGFTTSGTGTIDASDGAFNPTTGIYTCKAAGMHYFVARLYLTGMVGQAEALLTVNDEISSDSVGYRAVTYINTESVCA